MNELLAPAGDFQTALAAFNAGADAVYLGLKHFSARKGATNFSELELRRLKGFAKKNNKKIFVAMNTVVKESELSLCLETLEFLQFLKVDAVIVQDIGLARLIRDYFKDLPLHASTQMAIHNQSGVNEAKKLGISRTVLSRELSLKDITKLVKDNPDMEFEVFVHGALCYSFSGACLASGLMLDRSANRGSCAQICRNFFSGEGDEFYPFSMNDLQLKENTKALIDAGVHSFKIEGRMKGPSYVKNSVALYRKIIDGESVTASEKKESALTFSRTATSGFFDSKKGINLIDNRFPGHRGLFLGVAHKIIGKKFQIKVSEDLSVFDTILILKERGLSQKATIFHLEPKKVLAGNIATIELDDAKVSLNDQIYLTKKADTETILGHDHKLFPLYKKSLPLSIYLDDQEITLESSELNFTKSYALKSPIEEARGTANLTQIINELLSESKESRYLFTVSNLENRSRCDSPFIPKSVLKEIKNEWYLDLLNLPLNLVKYISPVFSSPTNVSNYENRAKFFENKLPFGAQDEVITIPPVLLDTKNYFDKVRERARSGSPQMIGLNNLSHLELARELKDEPRVTFFADFFFYVANSSTYSYLKETLGEKLIFAYEWVEERESELSYLVTIKDKGVLPYFYSLACYHRFNKNSGSCEGCSTKKYSYQIDNNKNRFEVIVNDCITYMFRR